MFENEKTTNQEQKPTQTEAVDMFTETKEPGAGAETQAMTEQAEQETGEQIGNVQLMEHEQEDSNRAFSRRNMILALIALVALLIIIGGTATYFFVFKKPSLTPAPEFTPSTGLTPQEQLPPVNEQQPSVQDEQQEAQSQTVQEQQTQIEQPAPVIDTPLDTDLDGLSDEEEAGLGTPINNADADSDGLTDREEVQVYKTSPLSADTDSDGFLDKQELDNGFDPNGSGKLPTGIPIQP